MTADTNKSKRWTRRANIERYCRLLNTPLTDTERQYIERRLAEERGRPPQYPQRGKRPSTETPPELPLITGV